MKIIDAFLKVLFGYKFPEDIPQLGGLERTTYSTKKTDKITGETLTLAKLTKTYQQAKMVDSKNGNREVHQRKTRRLPSRGKSVRSPEKTGSNARVARLSGRRRV